MTDSEYLKRSNDTLAHRMLRKLHELDVISETTLYDLLFPSSEEIKAAEKDMTE